jgi:hypothetical protein
MKIDQFLNFKKGLVAHENRPWSEKQQVAHENNLISEKVRRLWK